MAWCRIGILLGAMFVWSVTERAQLMSGNQQRVNSLWLLVLVVSAVTGTWKHLLEDAMMLYIHICILDQWCVLQYICNRVCPLSPSHVSLPPHAFGSFEEPKWHKVGGNNQSVQTKPLRQTRPVEMLKEVWKADHWQRQVLQQTVPATELMWKRKMALRWNFTFLNAISWLQEN